jgi:hypothetical protein
VNREAGRHLDSAAAHIAVAESGDAKRAAYKTAADEILAARKADPELGRVDEAQRLKKGETWVRDLLRWRQRPDADLPFSRSDRHRRYEERQVPTQHDDRVEMAGKLLADPAVAKAAMAELLAEKSKSQRLIEQAVSRKNAEERKRQMEAAMRKREGEAMPLPAYMSRMVVKMNEWAAGLANIEPDLEALPEGPGRETVLDALVELARQAQRCIYRLDPIEGRVRREIESRVE